MNHAIHINQNMKIYKRPEKHNDIENKAYTIVSSGMILFGMLTCFVSMSIGLSLISLGSMVLSEVNVY